MYCALNDNDLNYNIPSLNDQYNYTIMSAHLSTKPDQSNKLLHSKRKKKSRWDHVLINDWLINHTLN